MGGGSNSVERKGSATVIVIATIVWLAAGARARHLCSLTRHSRSDATDFTRPPSKKT